MPSLNLSHTQAPQEKEVSSKSIGVEQEGGKDHTLTHSAAPSLIFEGMVKEHRSGSILSSRPELGPKGKPQDSGQGVEGLTSDILNHFNSGVHFYNQREFSKAIQAYQKVIELDPTYVEAYNNLGITYQMMGDINRAFEAYEKATEINPKYEKGYNNLGTLLLLKDRDEEAVEAFQKALAINPNNIESHLNIGILFKKKGNWGKSIESYQIALTIDPFHKETHYNIALLYEQMESFELAISHFQQFIQLSQKSHPELVSKVQRHLNELTKKNN
jgi:tetratricopeptide (TPR) repeat protein